MVQLTCAGTHKCGPDHLVVCCPHEKVLIRLSLVFILCRYFYFDQLGCRVCYSVNFLNDWRIAIKSKMELYYVEFFFLYIRKHVAIVCSSDPLHIVDGSS